MSIFPLLHSNARVTMIRCAMALGALTAIAAPAWSEAPGPDIQGEWISKTCETRPTPHFLIRTKVFEEDSWSAKFYFYSDPACKELTLTVSVTGSYLIDGPSVKVPGAADAEFVFRNGWVAPMVPRTVGVLNFSPPGTCGTQPWTLGVEQNVTSTGGCSIIGFKIPITEFELARLKDGQLFFGARPTDGGNIGTESRRPTSYEDGLVRATSLDPASVMRPIITFPNTNPTNSLKIKGEWASKSCETRPGPHFLMRNKKFGKDKWKAKFDFYGDPDCCQRTLTVEVKGTYKVGAASAKVKGGADADFDFVTSALTPHVPRLVKAFNNAPAGTCGNRTWKLGKRQEITSTGGCSVLDFEVPITEHELTKISDGELYFGARPTDLSDLSAPESRPTSYDVPLKQARASVYEMKLLDESWNDEDEEWSEDAPYFKGGFFGNNRGN